MTEQYTVTQEGDTAEEYLIGSVSLLQWECAIEDSKLDSITFGEHDLSISKRMLNKLMAFINMKGALRTKLEKAENLAMFKKIFSSTCNAQAENLKVCLKVCDNEVVGVMEPDFGRLRCTDFTKKVLPKLNADQNLEKVYGYLDDNDSVAVYANMSDDLVVSLFGKRWHPGAVVSHSSVGNYDASICACLVPKRDSLSFYSLPIGAEDAYFYPSIQDFCGDFALNAVHSSIKSIPNVISRWKLAAKDELALGELEGMISSFFQGASNEEDLLQQPERKILERFASILACHGMDEGAKPSKQWKMSAQTNTSLEAAMRVATHITLGLDEFAEPSYFVGGVLDGGFSLGGLANNAKAQGLEDLEW